MGSGKPAGLVKRVEGQLVDGRDSVPIGVADYAFSAISLDGVSSPW
jgi:hypothetical protein